MQCGRSGVTAPLGVAGRWDEAADLLRQQAGEVDRDEVVVLAAHGLEADGEAADCFVFQ